MINDSIRFDFDFECHCVIGNVTNVTDRHHKASQGTSTGLQSDQERRLFGNA